MSEVRTESSLPTPIPVVEPDTRTFWEATDEGRLLITHCDACGENIWYPRPICPFCHSTRTSWLEVGGAATVYSFTVVRRTTGEWAAATPFVLAYVELDEGPRMMTNIVDCDPEQVAIGNRVRVVFDKTEALGSIPRFVPLTDDAHREARA